MDIHRTFAEVVFWEDGRLRPAGRIDMTRSGLEGLGRTLTKDDEVVIEATGNAMAVVRVLKPYVARVIVANPLQVKAIAHARIKTDKIDAGVLASLRAADFLPEIWLPDAETERLRRLVSRRNQVVRHRTRIKNEVHAILHARLIPRCPHADLFGRLGRAWLDRQPLPDDELAAITRHLRELDRLGEDLVVLDSEMAQAAINDAAAADDQRGSGHRSPRRDRRHQALFQPAEAGELRWSQSEGATVRAGAHGRISKQARAMLLEAGGKSARTAACLFHPCPRLSGSSNRGRRRCPQARCAGTCSARTSIINGRDRGWLPTSCDRCSGVPARKGGKRGIAYAYNVKELRDREIDVARTAESAYERFVSQWQPRRPKAECTDAAREERR
jgi:transposase